MTQQGEVKKKPGSGMTVAGIVMLVLGVVLLVINLSTTNVDYVPGLGTVQTHGTPSIAALVLIAAGLILAIIGFCRRLLAAVERR